MTTFSSARFKDEIILVARIMLVVLFVFSGWGKLTNYTGTVGYFTQIGAPMPPIAAVVAIIVEFFVALAVAIGLFVRPLALILVLFTLGTTLIGHQYWNLEGAARYGNWINFYKNISIMGGFLLLYVTGGGKYAVDAMLGRSSDAIAR